MENHVSGKSMNFSFLTRLITLLLCYNFDFTMYICGVLLPGNELSALQCCALPPSLSNE